MRGSQVVDRAHDVDVRRAPAALRRARNARMRRAQRVGVLARLDHLHQRDALAERRRDPAGLRRRHRPAPSPVSSVSSRITPRSRSTRVAHDIVRVGRAGRKIDLAGGRRVRRPSRRAGTRRRTSATPPSAKQLRIVLSGKPQSRQAMKLAKSVSRYAPLSTPPAISPRRSSSTRPFHISGFVDAQLREMRVDLGAPLDRERARRPARSADRAASAE